MQLAYYLTLTLLMMVSTTTTGTEIILALGDSLTAGYGIAQEQLRWPALLANKLAEQNYHIEIKNASISGITTQEGIRMLPELLQKYRPTVVIIALGSNDGLRGLSINSMRENLANMIVMCVAAKTQILLLEFKLPLNYGHTYRNQFEKVFMDLSTQYKVTLVPFLLKSFAQNLDYFQEDGLHPNVAAQPLMCEEVFPYVIPLLGK